MKAVIQQMIVDFVTQPLQKPLPRAIELPPLPGKKAWVLIGMRRSGKTWCMYQEMHHLLDRGFTKEQLVYLNFEDDRLSQFQTEDWRYILPAYIEAYPDHAAAQLALFLDEVHVAPNWEKFVLRMIEQENVLIYLSGSSAKMLSKEIATHLRGRTLTREVFPMSFKETLTAHNITVSNTPSTHERAQLQSHLNQYLQAGGFPETLFLDPALRTELIQNYIETVVYRDVVERYGIANIISVRQFIIHAIKNSAFLFSINKMYHAFKSLGINVSKNSLYEYAAYFEDAYCLFFTRDFQFSLRSQQQKPMKVYPVDPGIIMAYSIKPTFEMSVAFETVVFLHLRRQYAHVYYYHTPSRKEVDFLTQTPQGAITLYQACLDTTNTATWAREVSALEEAMHTLTIQESYLITLDSTASLNVSSGKIHCITLLDFLLGTR